MVFYLSGSLPLFEFVSISYCVVSLIWQINSVSMTIILQSIAAVITDILLSSSAFISRRVRSYRTLDQCAREDCNIPDWRGLQNKTPLAATLTKVLPAPRACNMHSYTMTPFVKRGAPVECACVFVYQRLHGQLVPLLYRTAIIYTSVVVASRLQWSGSWSVADFGIVNPVSLLQHFYARQHICYSASLRQRRVRLSVTRRYCAQQSESRIVKCTPSDSPMTLVSVKV